MTSRCLTFAAVTVALLAGRASAADAPTREDAERALRKAVTFYRSLAAGPGGYVWRYAADGKLREGEGRATKSMAWVQPPGTPTVGEAFLDAYDATGDKLYRDAARDTAAALLAGQMRTGGWFYHIEFDPDKRRAYGFRDVPKRRRQRQKTTLDDDTTTAAVRFLIRLDKTLGRKDKKVHEGVVFALGSILRAQYPNGGWYQWWDRPPAPASAKDFPVKKADYPESWPRKWQNDWTGRYFLNDNVAANVIATLLFAYETYGDEKYLAGAKKAGDFLILAQMPDPQPAWAQQYNVAMHPVWDRKFEPPAISGGESQGVMRALLLLYRKTGEKKYLEPVPRALAYLKKSRLPDGRLARFYELKTNKPLYFTKKYKLTYDGDDVPTHYGFVVSSKLDAIEREYNRLRKADPSSLKTEDKKEKPRLTSSLKARTRKVIDALDDRGAWVEEGRLKGYPKEKQTGGVIQSRTFADNVRTLCDFLAASK